MDRNYVCGGAVASRRGKSGNWTGVRERVAYGIASEIVNELRMAETHFDFRGVNVDVHFVVGQLEEKQNNWKDAKRDDIAIGVADGMEDQAIANQTAIYEDVDAIAIAALHFGPRGEPFDADFGGFFAGFERRLGDGGANRPFGYRNFDQLIECGAAEDLIHAFG